MWLISSCCLYMSCVVVSLESPQILMFCLVSQSFLVVMLSGYMSSIWYSYVLFLVFLGGMLVIFVYVSSLAANIKMDYITNFSFKIVSGVLVFMWMLSFSKFNFMLSNEIMLSLSTTSMIYTLMSNWMYIIYIFIVGYLLVTLYCVCWLMKFSEGPLRSFM